MGEIILFLAGMIKFLSTTLKFIIVIGIVMGVFIFTIVATFEAFHLIVPEMQQTAGYAVPNDIFAKDLWAWVVAILGWTTMVYGVQKMFAADKAEDKRMEEARKTWQ